MDTVVLKCANHFPSGAIAAMGESRIFVPAKMSLQNPSIFRTIENGAPRFKLADAVRRFLRVQLSHAPLVHILTAAHGIGEVDLPIVALIDISERRRNSALSHHRVRLAQKRFANKPNANTSRRSF